MHKEQPLTRAIEGQMPAAEPDAPRKVALIAHCLLNQNAKVCEGARYRGVVNPVIEALRSRGFCCCSCPALSLRSPVRDVGGPSMSNMTRRRIGLTAGDSHRASRR